MFSTLAQINKKDFDQANQRYQKEQQQSFEIIKSQKPTKKVDVQYELERKIIEILLLYGNRTEEFEDLVLKENDEGELILEPEVQETRVFEKVYLDLQEDEMEFSNDNFRSLYYTIIDALNQNPDFQLREFVNQVSPEVQGDITSILMNDERHQLHDWERKNIYPKGKDLNKSSTSKP